MMIFFLLLLALLALQKPVFTYQTRKNTYNNNAHIVCGRAPKEGTW
jgi:hypothetical protein